MYGFSYHYPKGAIQFLIGLLITASISTVFAPEAAARPNAVRGQYLMKFRKKAGIHAHGAMRQFLGVRVLRKMRRSGAELVELPAGKELDTKYAKQLLAAGHIEYFEPNYIFSISSTPNDSSFSSLWGLHNTGQTGGTPDIDIDAPEAWDQTTGSSAVVVGVIDTGVAYNHPDLAANIWTNTAEIPSNGIDDDSNGYVDDVHGMNAITGSGDPADDHGHGSHCSGTIGGVSNNSQGVAGVNWNVKIMGLKFLNSSGSGTSSDAIEAIEYAILMKERGVNLRVLSNSWGGGGYSQAMEDAIIAAKDAGILFVAAAGNSSNDNDIVSTYPANYDIENVISVAAVDHDGNLASFSNYGAATVHLAAPGVGILSTITNGGYASWQGTSMAAPHVSGVAALVLSVAPTLSVSELSERLLLTVKPLSTLSGILRYAGLVNALNAIRDDRSNLPPPAELIEYIKQVRSIDHETPVGTRVLATDDGYTTVDLGFDFPYYGDIFRRLTISANGRAIPLADGADPINTADFANTLTAGINPYHDDLYPSPHSQGGVYFKTSDSQATITWASVHYADRASTNSDTEIIFQLKIFSSGLIEFHYQDNETGGSGFDAGASASVGIVPPVGASGKRMVITHNQANPNEIGSGRALSLSQESQLDYVKNDFDGDGSSDIVVWRPENGTWYFRYSGAGFAESQQNSIQHGLPGDIPLVDDFDGDGKADIAVWRPEGGNWYFRFSSENFSRTLVLQWGLKGDIPLTGHFDSDNRGDLIVYRPSSQMFFVLNSSAGFNRDGAVRGESGTYSIITSVYGEPIVGDINGSGRDELGVKTEQGFWVFKNNSNELVLDQPWGGQDESDRGFLCDFNSNGRKDLIITRLTEKLTLNWWALDIEPQTGGQSTEEPKFNVYLDTYGSLFDQEDCGDFDGDDKTDPVVYRPGTGEWFIRLSGSASASSEKGEIQVIEFGQPGDIAL